MQRIRIIDDRSLQVHKGLAKLISFNSMISERQSSAHGQRPGPPAKEKEKEKEKETETETETETENEEEK